MVSYTELKPLLDLIGPANALEILLEGRIHGAEDALRMGLVNRVVADAEVEHEAFATAVRIAEGAPLVARWHKKFTRRLMQPEPLSDEEMDESFHCFETEDFRAGYQAFLAKASPSSRAADRAHELGEADAMPLERRGRGALHRARSQPRDPRRAARRRHGPRPTSRVDDLAPVGEFHIRGREATVELARRSASAPGHACARRRQRDRRRLALLRRDLRLSGSPAST